MTALAILPPSTSPRQVRVTCRQAWARWGRAVMQAPPAQLCSFDKRVAGAVLALALEGGGLHVYAGVEALCERLELVEPRTPSREPRGRGVVKRSLRRLRRHGWLELAAMHRSAGRPRGRGKANEYVAGTPTNGVAGDSVSGTAVAASERRPRERNGVAGDSPTSQVYDLVRKSRVVSAAPTGDAIGPAMTAGDARPETAAPRAPGAPDPPSVPPPRPARGRHRRTTPAGRSWTSSDRQRHLAALPGLLTELGAAKVGDLVNRELLAVSREDLAAAQAALAALAARPPPPPAPPEGPAARSAAAEPPPENLSAAMETALAGDQRPPDTVVSGVP